MEPALAPDPATPFQLQQTRSRWSNETPSNRNLGEPERPLFFCRESRLMSAAVVDAMKLLVIALPLPPHYRNECYRFGFVHFCPVVRVGPSESSRDNGTPCTRT